MREKEPYWVGNATTEKFSVTARELDEAIELRDKWRREIELDRGDEGVEISPGRGDAERNSRASGDHNLLHQDPEVVEDVAEKYKFVREPTTEGVVVSQGMSFVDALVGELDGPVRSVGGSWEKMVYAAETGETDTVVLSEEAEGDFSAELQPAGTEDVIDAGEVSFDFAEEEGNYHQEHNEYMTALADQAVGRGFEQPGVRNGELLISNELEAYGPVDWDRAEEFVFNLSEVEEGEHQVTADWDIDVDYGGETEESAISYSETSMYADGFEEIASVEGNRRSNPFQAYMDASKATARATTEASLTPVRIGTALMESMTPRSD
ncbi:MAG: hypothetical protein ABEJ36_01410 [Candidatus Nanosalina sp.]